MADYQRPTSLADALNLLSADRVIVAGATDIYPGRTQQHAWGESCANRWLDITSIPELRGIEYHSNQWYIGALVTFTELIESDLPAAFNGLKAAAREVGGLQIQNRATLVGNLCNASPAADGVPPLLCLDAKVQLVSLGGSREIPVNEFIKGNRQTLLAADEMVTGIVIPDIESSATGYFYKLGARRYLVISIVMASMIVIVDELGRIVECRLAIGACSEVAMRMTALEAMIKDKSPREIVAMEFPDKCFEELRPVDDLRASAAYRQAAARELVRHLFTQTEAGLR